MMDKLELVSLNIPANFKIGEYVKPKEGSGLTFLIGKIVSEGDEHYVGIKTENGVISTIKQKLQGTSLYLVKKEKFSPGDWYYYPETAQPKRKIEWRDYSARKGRINKDIDAKLFSLSPAKKIIYHPKNIGLKRDQYSTITSSADSLSDIDIQMIHRIILNNGECWIEDKLEGDKVIIHEKDSI